MSIRIALIDDHNLIRQGVRRIITSEPEFTVVAEGGSGLEAIRLAHQYRPEIIVMDIGMKDLNGIEATSQIVHELPKIAVLILSMYGDERYVTQAVKAGARGYLLKDSVEYDLLEALRTISRGHSFFSPSVARIIADCYHFDSTEEPVEDRFTLLTQRERAIYQLLAEGLSNKSIAGRLGLSLHTVETHRVRVMAKLNIHSVVELVLSAVRRGLVS